MKKYLSVFVSLLLAVSLAGCNNGIDNPEYTTAENGTQIISENTAMRVAAEKADLASEDVKYTNVAYGASDNGNKYDVGFLHEGYEYSVTVDADNGKIEFFEKTEITGIIDEETALNKAVLESDIEELVTADGETFDKEKLTDVKIELDKDDGEFEYEIEFKYETAKYVYSFEIDINAVDGSLKETECKPYSKDADNGDINAGANDDDDNEDYSVEIGETLPQESSDAVSEESSDIAVEDPSVEVSEDISAEVSMDASQEEIPVHKPEKEPVVAPENAIGEDAALNAALAKAELTDVTKEQLENFKLKLDEDDGVFEYDIDFCYNGIKYEIDVDTLTGDILDFETKEIKKPENKPADGENSGSGTDIPPVEGDVPPAEESKPTIDESNLISEKDAYNIALTHSGVDESTIEKLHIDLERKHGKAEYEIEFISGYTEYDYDIDAVTGEIISFDKEAESCDAPDFSKPSDEEYIGEDAALTAAYAHAGVSHEDATDAEIELEKGRGVFKYEIEFKCGDTEYEYDINALDGSVMQYAKEIDD